ncbi:zf-TFIIB domain-containing protein [Xanthobacter autotrophicus]|nr:MULTISPECIES: zf-TFIIB domain-containing protein [unclassified Xanthobacter]
MIEPSAQGLLCPVCRTDLVMTERQNVEIDYCPRCRGIWLDRGELDRIVERSIATVTSSTPTNAPPSSTAGQPSAPMPWGQTPGGYSPAPGAHGSKHHGSSHDSHGSSREHGGHKRGFLGRLFD